MGPGSVWFKVGCKENRIDKTGVLVASVGRGPSCLEVLSEELFSKWGSSVPTASTGLLSVEYVLSPGYIWEFFAIFWKNH